MKLMLTVGGMIAAALLAWLLTSRLSADALGMAVGMVFGLLAGIPAALLVMVTSRMRPHDDDEDETRRAVYDPNSRGHVPYQYLPPVQAAPVVVVVTGHGQPQRCSAWDRPPVALIAPGYVDASEE